MKKLMMVGWEEDWFERRFVGKKLCREVDLLGRREESHCFRYAIWIVGVFNQCNIVE